MLDKTKQDQESESFPELASAAPPEAGPHDYRPYIDGLRAIAVSSVVVFHAFPTILRGGFIGVDIFFVISGFLITSQILKNLANESFSVVDFYRRRIRRIFPALLLILGASLLFGRLALFSGENQQLGKHVAGGVGFISNLMFWNEAGYFDNSADTKPLLHLWSLGIEEQFYIVWPIMLWATLKSRASLLGMIVIATLASFCINLGYAGIDAAAAFYLPQTRFWELLMGALLAWTSMQPSALHRLSVAQRSRFSICGFLMVVAGLTCITSASRYPGWWALLPTTGAVLIIAAGADAFLNRVVLSSKVLVWIGLISYPLYLWHWPLLSFARIINGADPDPSVKAALMVAAIVLAWLTFSLLERPLRRGGHANLKTLCLITVALAVGSIGYLEFNSSIDAAANTVEAQFVGPSTPWKYGVNDTCRTRFSMPGSEDYSWWFCMLQRDAPPTAILLGNSQTNSLFPGFAKSAAFSDENFLSIGTCPPPWVDKAEPTPAITISPCSGNRPYEQMMFINELIETNKSLRLAIVSSLPTEFASDYVEALRKRISFLENHGIQVVVFAASVPLGYDTRACYPRVASGTAASCEVSAEAHRYILKNFETLQTEIHKSNPKTLFYDPNGLNCGWLRCVFKIDGMPMYRDQFGHLSEYGSLQIAKNFSAWATLHAPSILAH